MKPITVQRIVTGAIIFFGSWWLSYNVTMMLVHETIPAVQQLGHNPGRGLDPLSNAQALHAESPQQPCDAVYDAPGGNLKLCWGQVYHGKVGTTYSDPRSR